MKSKCVVRLAELAPNLLKSAIAGLELDDVDVAVNNGYVLLVVEDEFEIDEGPHPMSEKDEFFA
jgi:hypothetical protein